MTGTPAHSPEPTGHWVAARHSELLDNLGQYLDPDAGLRDIMLHADHSDVIGTLGSHLDTQAGLAAILPSSAETAPKPPDQTQTAAAIAAVDPAVRMTLRRSPVILAAILSDLTVRALTLADKARAVRECDLTRDFGLSLALAFARALNRDLARARAGALDNALAGILDHARDFTLEVASALAGDLEDGLDQRPDPDHWLAHALALEVASDLANALHRAVGITNARVPGRDAAEALARDLANHVKDELARDLGITTARDLNRALNRDLARDLARHMAVMAGDAFGITQTENLAAALLEGALDDFTRADLARADLTGYDLTGIRWSDWGTTWPPGTDTDALRAQSREVTDASGIYVITDPGHDDKARHHTRT
jgi:hypothetical protein